MRKSLPKTPRSGLSSAPPPAAAHLPAARASRADAALNRKPAARPRVNGTAPGNGRPSSMTMIGRQGHSAARQRLLEGFLSRTEIADAAQYALQWLAEALGIEQSMCL